MNIIILVGPPGSGKSTLAHTYIDQGYKRVSQDDQGKNGHLDHFYLSLLENDNIIVDRMSFNKQQRERYLKPAKEAGYTTKIIVLHEPRKVCFERMMLRKGHPTIKNDRDANNALNTFFSKYERPTEDEADIIQFVYPQGNKPNVAVIDLDGTLCNTDKRLHHVKKENGERKNWKAFFEELVNDEPNMWCEKIIHSLVASNTNIVFASGRPDDYYSKTSTWLEEYGFSDKHLYMRCRGDHRQDYIAKEIILDFEILTRFNPLFFIDDRQQVVDLWRRRGFVALQCDKGDF